MPKAKYEPIYRLIREDIETGKLGYGDFLPSENEYADRFGCTRNTVRRALSMLAAEGFVLPQHGRGVQVIYRLEENRAVFTIGGIESFAEASGLPLEIGLIKNMYVARTFIQPTQSMRDAGVKMKL